MTPRPTAVLLCLALAAAACGDDDSGGGAPDDTVATAEPPAPPTAPADTAPAGTAPADTAPADNAPADTRPDGDIGEGGTVTLVTYDSFPEAETSLNAALDSFTEQTGIEVDLLVAGDTGTMLSKATLTVGNPEGDVMWGIDNTFLSRALDAGVFEPYPEAPVEPLRDDLVALVPGHEVVPVDFGDVCVNYDLAYFADRELAPPASLADLTDPAYRDLLVVQNPATSSPGLAFLLATVHEYGTDGWQDYWAELDANGVEVVDGWTEAYYERFSWAGGGPRPLVVSYGSSPPAEVIFADPPRDDAPTGVVESTCFRQVEFAGVLAGTDQPEAARALVDFLIGEEFQSEIALNLFVYPANESVPLPPEFEQFAVIPDESRSVDLPTIDANRAAWIDEWTGIVLG